ncbi:hypothetical protein [Flavobacterium sp. ZS1P14]|uniref:hypothetical protein n=1 Tax=Flavobacterium sp. ZS1P14 TaxID=3401729 RepID=UPI003AB0F4BD
MKTQTSKKLFAFIITVMMFSGFTQFASAQKGCNDKHPCPSGGMCINKRCVWFCQCNLRGYGCSGNPDCISFCRSYCPIPFAENKSNDETIFNGIYHPDSQSAGISFTLSQPEKMSVKIIDENGRLMETLADGMLVKGEHELLWKMADVQAGTYYLQLDKEMHHEIARLCVIKDNLD